MLYRLQEEYNLDVLLNKETYTVARWPRNVEGKSYEGPIKGAMTTLQDSYGEKVVLLDKEWDLQWAIRENPDVIFAASIEPTRK